MSAAKSSFGKHLRKDFHLVSEYIPINHGSYGANPKSLKKVMDAYREQLESHPDRFYRKEMQPLLEENLGEVAKLIHCDVEDMTFIMHASEGVNNILRSYPFNKGDKILCYQTAYVSIDKTLEFMQDHHDLELVKIHLDYPMEDEEIVRLTREAIEREHAKSGENKIRFAVFDAISSLPGVRFPFEKINTLAHEHNILTLIDGAHSIGHIDLNLTELDPDYFVSTTYKWLFIPRGSAIMYVAKRHQGFVHPSSINPFYQRNKDAADRSSFKKEHYFTAVDPIPFLCIKPAMVYRKSIGGEEAISQYCHNLAVEGGQLVADILGTQVMENSAKTLTTNMVTVELPPFKTSKSDAEVANFYLDKAIYEHNTMFPVFKASGKWWVRLSGAVYLDLDDFKQVGEILSTITASLDKEA